VKPIRHRIVTANIYVGNKDPRGGVQQIITECLSVFGARPDVIGIQEGHGRGILDELAKVKGYQLLVARDQGEAGKDVPTLLRTRWQLLDQEFTHTVEGTGTGVFDHPRGFLTVRYVKRGVNVAVVNTHMGVIGRAREEEAGAGGKVAPSAADHAKHAAIQNEHIAQLRAEGFTVFVTADANAHEGVWTQSLPSVLETSGMRVTIFGVDMIASDPERTLEPKIARVPKELTGSDDHDALVISAIEKGLNTV
jgi:hypothetical protein